MVLAMKPSGVPAHKSNAQVKVLSQALNVGLKKVPAPHSCGNSVPLIHNIQFLHDLASAT